MFNLSPFGMVRTVPDGTIMFAGAVAVFVRVQLKATIQSLDIGGRHARVCVTCNEFTIDIESASDTTGVVLPMNVDQVALVWYSPVTQTLATEGSDAAPK